MDFRFSYKTFGYILVIVISNNIANGTFFVLHCFSHSASLDSKLLAPHKNMRITQFPHALHTLDVKTDVFNEKDRVRLWVKPLVIYQCSTDFVCSVAGGFCASHRGWARRVASADCKDSQ